MTSNSYCNFCRRGFYTRTAFAFHQCKGHPKNLKWPDRHLTSTSCARSTDALASLPGITLPENNALPFSAKSSVSHPSPASSPSPACSPSIASSPSPASSPPPDSTMKSKCNVRPGSITSTEVKLFSTDRKQRIKLQNKKASRKYRTKQKQDLRLLNEEINDLLEKNKTLHDEITEKSMQVRILKELCADLLIKQVGPK